MLTRLPCYSIGNLDRFRGQFWVRYALLNSGKGIKHRKTQGPGIKATPIVEKVPASIPSWTLAEPMKSFTVAALLAMATSAFAGTISATPATPANLKVRRRYLPWIRPVKGLSLSTVAQRRDWSYQRSVDQQRISGNMVHRHHQFHYLADNTTTLAKRYGPEVVTCYNTGTKVCTRLSCKHYLALLHAALENVFRGIVHPSYLWLTTGASTLHYSTVS